VLAWLVAVAVVYRVEANRLAAIPADQPFWVSAITNLDVDTSLYVPLLLFGPFACWPLLRKAPEPTSPSEQTTPRTSLRLSWGLAALAGVGGFLASTTIHDKPVLGEVSFGQLPPAYHDEYAYLFQARTFLDGRTTYPTTEPEGLFDQMHVLNHDGVFASRYFPATGVWMAPFVASDRPYAGHRIANALIAAAFCFAACRAAGWLAGVVTGSCLALSPGIAIFSNLLLAHHPTLVGLSLFTIAIFESRRAGPMLFGALAGTGLAFAMLARPMSAAGFALPFGVWVFVGMLRNHEQRAHFRRVAMGLAVPLVAGFVVLAAYNRSVTGNWLSTPYQVYTDVYTPNHVFGFDNVIRGSQVDAPKRIARYDSWAENLTPELAWRNAGNRVRASFSWTLGLVPTTLLAAFSLCTFHRLRLESRLALLSILSLHIVHIPYWYDGILHYHYVFESGVMWCLLAGIVVADLQGTGVLKPRSWTAAWLVACLLASLLPAWFELPNPLVEGGKLFPMSRVDGEVQGISFSRRRYHQFRQGLGKLQQPALVLVEHDEADIHLEYVNNPPTLDQNVLTGHLHAFEEAADSETLFPERTIYVFDAKKLGQPDAFQLLRRAQ